MKLGQQAVGLALTFAMLVTACSGIPSWISRAFGSGDQPIAELSRCGIDPSTICLVSFGLDDNNKMLISLFVPTSSTLGYYLKVDRDESTAVYPCQAVQDFPTSVYCVGEPIPLGTSVNIGVYSTEGNSLLAKGSFVINALSLPTPINFGSPAVTGVIPSTAASTPVQTITATQTTKTPTPTQTPKTPGPTHTPKTPTPGSYPNP